MWSVWPSNSSGPSLQPACLTACLPGCLPSDTRRECERVCDRVKSPNALFFSDFLEREREREREKERALAIKGLASRGGSGVERGAAPHRLLLIYSRA